MRSLNDLIGTEAGLPEVARAIYALARSLNVPVVGGYHITCSDETEWECAEIFQQVLAESMLPPLKPGRRVAFHTMNLGARYETGAIHVAESHYATPEARQATKLMVVKINSHVGVRMTPDGPAYGTVSRYGSESGCCGALNAMLKDVSLPVVKELKATFEADGIDRVAVLRDGQSIRPDHRVLLAAVTNARLQAARAVADIAERRPASPTVYLVVACVTINRSDAEDSELVVGQYAIDATEEVADVHYRGLGDLPLEYRVSHRDGLLVIEDDRWPISGE